MTTLSAIDSTLRNVTLGDVVVESGGAIQTGPFGSQLHARDYVLTGTPIVMPTNLGDNRIVEKSIARVGRHDVERLKRHRLREGDIVLSRRGDVGRRAIVSPYEAGWLCGTGCLAVRFGRDQVRVNPAFIALYMGTDRVQTWLLNNAVGGTMPNLNTGILAATPISLPSRPHQDAIVVPLENIARLVVSLERLIAKKEAINQGTMQQLLGGQTRLPGFTEAWSTYKLNQLGSFLKGRGIKRDDVQVAGVACIRYGEIYTTYRNYTSATVSFVNANVATGALPIQRGDLLFAGSGETRAEIGKCIAFTGTQAAVAGGDIIVLRAPDVNPCYLACLVNMPKAAAQKARLGQGDAVVHIHSHALGSIDVELPSRDEQDAIARVLVDADREIRALESCLAKARSIKQGMMQELLTGRTRLPLVEQATI
jgi:type I restriction enzyme, S subunit